MKKTVVLLIFCLVQSFAFAQNDSPKDKKPTECPINSKLDSLSALSFKYNMALEKFNLIVLKIKNSGAFCPDCYQKEPGERKRMDYKAMLAQNSERSVINAHKISAL